jgi:hypothetical protein
MGVPHGTPTTIPEVCPPGEDTLLQLDKIFETQQ